MGFLERQQIAAAADLAAALTKRCPRVWPGSSLSRQNNPGRRSAISRSSSRRSAGNDAVCDGLVDPGRSHLEREELDQAADLAGRVGAEILVTDQQVGAGGAPPGATVLGPAAGAEREPAKVALALDEALDVSLADACQRHRIGRHGAGRGQQIEVEARRQHVPRLADDMHRAAAVVRHRDPPERPVGLEIVDDAVGWQAVPVDELVHVRNSRLQLGAALDRAAEQTAEQEALQNVAGLRVGGEPDGRRPGCAGRRRPARRRRTSPRAPRARSGGPARSCARVRCGCRGLGR